MENRGERDGDKAQDEVSRHQTTWDLENHVSRFAFILRAMGSYGRVLRLDLGFKKSLWLQSGQWLTGE